MRYISAWIALSLVCACTTAPVNRSNSQQPQIAELHHVFVTVDPVTAEAIRGSEFLRRFANLEVRTTTGTRATWTGRYLYGRRSGAYSLISRC